MREVPSVLIALILILTLAPHSAESEPLPALACTAGREASLFEAGPVWEGAWLQVYGQLETGGEEGELLLRGACVRHRRDGSLILVIDGARQVSLETSGSALVVTERIRLPWGPGGRWVEEPVRRWTLRAGRNRIRVDEASVALHPAMSLLETEALLSEVSRFHPEDPLRPVEDDTAEVLLGRLLKGAMAGQPRCLEGFIRACREWPLDSGAVEVHADYLELLAMAEEPSPARVRWFEVHDRVSALGSLGAR